MNVLVLVFLKEDVVSIGVGCNLGVAGGFPFLFSENYCLHKEFGQCVAEVRLSTVGDAHAALLLDFVCNNDAFSRSFIFVYRVTNDIGVGGVEVGERFDALFV